MPAASKHILIVEDSPDLQALLGRLFESEGYQLSRAYNGKEALDQLAAMPELPKLILLDVMMPVMEGMEFRQRQMNDPRLASIPVIVMTADANSQSKARALGIADFVKKPINDIDALLATVERLSS